MPLSSGVDFHRLFESAPGLYLILSPDLTIAAVTDAYLQATMTVRENILGRNIFEVFPDNPDDPAATGVANLKASLQYVLKHGRPHTMAIQQYDIRRPDGSFETRYWSPLNKPVMTATGDIGCIIHRVEDVTDFMRMKKGEQQRQALTENLQVKVTEMEMEMYNRSREIQDINTRLIEEVEERRKAEEQARRHKAVINQQKKEIQHFIDSMSTMCAKVNTDGHLLMVNRTALEASGYSMEQLQNTNFLDGPWWNYDKVVQERVRDAFQTACSGIPVNYDETINIFGHPLPINFSLIPILKPDRSVDYIVAEGRDISALKSTERALQKQTAELEKINKELEAFSYSVSHDLRAPLRIIDGYTGIMIDDYSKSLDGEGQRLLGIIKDNVRKMGQLIDDLLNLSRLGRRELVIQYVDMNKLVESVLSELLDGKPKKYQIEMNRLEPAICDSSLLRQVWINLLSNAIKYSAGTETPKITIRSHKSGNEIVYSVRDNGVGFNMKYADKLFGVFQRLHKVTEFEGAGVGLALVQQIISRHEGRVWADAEPGKGAEFFFSLQGAQKPAKDHSNFQTISQP